VNPPDQRSNPQRIFVPVPRTALESLTVLAVLGAPRRPRRGPTDDQRQVANSRRRENAVEVTPSLNGDWRIRRFRSEFLIPAF
jgi:hypothetical protein